MRQNIDWETHFFILDKGNPELFLRTGLILFESNPASRYLDDNYPKELDHIENEKDEGQFTNEDLILDPWSPMEQLRGRKGLRETKISHMFRLRKRVSRYSKRKK